MPVSGEQVRYKANATNGALLVPQSRIVASLMLKYPNKSEWLRKTTDNNILQYRSPATSKRIASFIISRLSTMEPPLWVLIKEGHSKVATEAVFAAALKHCRFLADYMYQVLRERFIHLDDKLSKYDWQNFILDCQRRDSNVSNISPNTLAKMRSNIHQMLSEVGYLEDARSLKLQRVAISPEVLDYLKKHNEDFVLRCIQL